MVLCACNSNNSHTESILTADHSKSCELDSSLSSICLMDASSLDVLDFNEIQKYRYNDLSYGEGVCVVNKLNTEYLFMRFNPGGMEREFDTFTLTNHVSAYIKNNSFHSEIPHFVSTHGAFIGMNLQDFLRAYPCVVKSSIDGQTLYTQLDSTNLLYNHFYFVNNILKGIEMGYDW